MAPFVGGDIHDRPQTLPRPGFLVGVFLLRRIRREEKQTRGAGGRGRRGAARAEEAAERRGKGGGWEDGGPDTYRRGMKMMGQEVRRFGRASSPVFMSAVCGSGTPESDKNYRSCAWGWSPPALGPGLPHCCAVLFWLRLRNAANSYGGFGLKQKKDGQKVGARVSQTHNSKSKEAVAKILVSQKMEYTMYTRAILVLLYWLSTFFYISVVYFFRCNIILV
jgi:hypothetical protein